MSAIPFLLYGDGPRLSTGLARIARDLAMRLVAEEDALGIRFGQVGVDYPGGWQWQAWDLCGFQPNPQDQGRDAVKSCLDEMNRACGRTGVLFMIMDPARCYDLLREREEGDPPQPRRLPAETWGYYPLDATNRISVIGGPAARAVLDTDRLIGYGRWGAQVLRDTVKLHQPKVRHARPLELAPIAYLPHGIDTEAFRPRPLEEADAEFRAWAEAVPSGAVKIGCVATNQPRKDLGLLFASIAEIKASGERVALWLHTDKATSAWDVGELAYTCGLTRQEVAMSLHELNDVQLAARYAWSDVTLAPGLGEGFGYPIVESLASGTPVVHGRYAGGVELIPDPHALVEPWAWRLESVYALLRPVFKPSEVAATLLVQGRRKQQARELVSAYCAGAVSYLSWQYLWPRWRAWIAQGLERVREG